jgi:hypothetical protein
MGGVEMTTAMEELWGQYNERHEEFKDGKVRVSNKQLVTEMTEMAMALALMEQVSLVRYELSRIANVLERMEGRKGKE